MRVLEAAAAVFFLYSSYFSVKRTETHPTNEERSEVKRWDCILSITPKLSLKRS